MSNSYLKAAFALLMSREDAALLREAEKAVDLLDTNGTDDELAAAYDTLDERFRAVFPPKGDNRFESFLELFEDWNFPYLDARIAIEDVEGEDNVRVTFTGDQFGVDQVAKLIFRACKSALPCGFAWSHDSDRLKVGDFGGGCVVITDAGIQWHTTQGILERAFKRLDAGAYEGLDGFVLATRDSTHGLSFWNNDNGFGSLATATVFTEGEAADFDKPIANDEPEWLALPAPTAV
ncbi:MULTISPECIES: hypothetical protein [Alphaproteobacteria]|uniref:hypothetical protein n=1 Tax=Alphaproteobacteria TaxID=28211 RepID=UPI00262AE498|nr:MULTISPECIES: hypothetical protein [Alphaproteobacteria]